MERIDYWGIFWTSFAVWSLGHAVYLASRKRIEIRLEVWLGILVYGLLLAIFNVLFNIYDFIGRVVFNASHRQRQPERPREANSVPELVSVYKLGKPMEVVTGFDRKRPIKVDFGKHHTLIGSSTGGGKTNQLNSLLIQFFGKGRRFSESHKVYLIDLKGDENDCLHMWQPLLAGYATVDIDTGIGQAIQLLEAVIHEMRHGDASKRIVLIIDEVAMLTHQAPDRNQRDIATRLLTTILSQIRSRGVVIMAVQHPRFDVVPTPIRTNADRKLMFVVDSRDQARVILGMRPNEKELPVSPGEFLLKEPGVRGLIHGQAMLVRLPGDIDVTLYANIEDNANNDMRLRLFHDVAASLEPGASLAGINKVAPAHKDIGHDYIKNAYRNYANAGALTPPETRGQSYLLAMAYPAAVAAIQKYISEGRWSQNADAFIEVNGQHRSF